MSHSFSIDDELMVYYYYSWYTISKLAVSGLHEVLPSACGGAFFLPLSPNSWSAEQVRFCLQKVCILCEYVHIEVFLESCITAFTVPGCSPQFPSPLEVFLFRQCRLPLAALITSIIMDSSQICQVHESLEQNSSQFLQKTYRDIYFSLMQKPLLMRVLEQGLLAIYLGSYYLLLYFI